MTWRTRVRDLAAQAAAGLRRFSLPLVLAGLIVMASVVDLAVDTREAETSQLVAEQQRDDTAESAIDVADPIVALCTGGDDVARRLTEVGACAAAQQVVAQPVAEPRLVEGPRGPSPTPEQIRAAVAAYLIDNPPPGGRAPTAVEVAAAVAAYLTANPPVPGRPPTSSEIAAAVQLYFATNPPAPGRDGEPGRPPTPEEVAAAVDAYLSANPPPPGERGERGVQGIGVTSSRAEIRDDQCVLIFVLLDPGDGSTAEAVVPVAGGVCDDGGLLGP